MSSDWAEMTISLWALSQVNGWKWGSTMCLPCLLPAQKRRLVLGAASRNVEMREMMLARVQQSPRMRPALFMPTAMPLGSAHHAPCLWR